MSRRNVVDIRFAVLLRQQEALRAELVKLANGFTRVLNGHARCHRPRWQADMEARRAARVAAVLRELGRTNEKVWRMLETAKA